MHMTATLTKWYDEHGRHEIFAGGKRVSMAGGNERNLQLLQLKEELVTETEQQDLDKLGIAKNARDEKLRKRDAAQLKVLDPAADALAEKKNREMMKLYKEVVLGEKQPEGFVPLTTLGAPAKPKPSTVEEDEVAGVPGD
jgi:hypothetical protein